MRADRGSYMKWTRENLRLNNTSRDSATTQCSDCAWEGTFAGGSAGDCHS